MRDFNGLIAKEFFRNTSFLIWNLIKGSIRIKFSLKRLLEVSHKGTQICLMLEEILNLKEFTRENLQIYSKCDTKLDFYRKKSSAVFNFSQTGKICLKVRIFELVRSFLKASLFERFLKFESIQILTNKTTNCIPDDSNPLMNQPLKSL